MGHHCMGSCRAGFACTDSLASFHLFPTTSLAGLEVPTNTEADKAANIVQAQFPSSGNSSDASILVVIQGTSVYSEALQQSVLKLNQTLYEDSNIRQLYWRTKPLFS